jgi:hypothetical protein
LLKNYRFDESFVRGSISGLLPCRIKDCVFWSVLGIREEHESAMSYRIEAGCFRLSVVLFREHPSIGVAIILLLLLDSAAS